jgi:hypothetical protein
MTQEQSILKYMKTVGPITPLEALQSFGCFRLSARILELRQKGHPIDSTIIKRGRSRVAQYSMKRSK